MKKIITLAVTVALIFSINFSSALAADETCILIKFSNDTRYQSLDTAAVLSELVLEKLLANGFNINESKPIDEDMEQKLFYEKSAELVNAEKALANKNLSLIFENLSKNFFIECHHNNNPVTFLMNFSSCYNAIF